MNRLTTALFSAYAFMVLMMALASAQGAHIKTRGLLVNLTTDDSWSAAKAISFAHQKALKNCHMPVAIRLHVRAVYPADTKRPSHVHGLMHEPDKSIQDMLTACMTDGGIVVICSACSKAAGLNAWDYIDGLEMGTWPRIESIVFDTDMTILAC